MAIAGIDHVAITVADVERTLEFYERVLGARPLYHELWRQGRIPVVLLELPGCRISVHAADAPAEPHARVPAPGSEDLCLRWDAPLRDACALLEAHGVPIVEGPVPRPACDGSEGRSVYFRDPDGNLLELLTTHPD